jgi:hypothetical protein
VVLDLPRLSGHPEACRIAPGKPPDWWQFSFKIEKEAHQWLKDALARSNHIGEANFLKVGNLSLPAPSRT